MTDNDKDRRLGQPLVTISGSGRRLVADRRALAAADRSSMWKLATSGRQLVLFRVFSGDGKALSFCWPRGQPARRGTVGP